MYFHCKVDVISSPKYHNVMRNLPWKEICNNGQRYYVLNCDYTDFQLTSYGFSLGEYMYMNGVKHPLSTLYLKIEISSRHAFLFCFMF